VRVKRALNNSKVARSPKSIKVVVFYINKKNGGGNQGLCGQKVIRNT
jgi:hypothetical protein